MKNMELLKISATILVPFVLFGCNGLPVNHTPQKYPTSNFYLGYQPIDPIPAKRVTFFDPSTQKEVTVPWSTLEYVRQSKDAKVSSKYPGITVQSLLPLQSARVTVQKADGSGKLTYLSSSISGSVGTYEVVMDYMKYRVQPVSIDGDYKGDGIVGVGLRIRALVTTKKANINLGSLLALGVEASQNNLSGSIAVDVIGIDSKDITNLIPLSAEIDQTAIQGALQGLAAIKAKLWQDDTHLYPHLLALKQHKPGTANSIQRTVAVYSRTSSSDTLRTYWKPDGESVDKDHEKKLKLWMSQHGIQGPITVFLSSKGKEDLRRKAVQDLVSICD